MNVDEPATAARPPRGVSAVSLAVVGAIVSGMAGLGGGASPVLHIVLGMLGTPLLDLLVRYGRARRPRPARGPGGGRGRVGGPRQDDGPPECRRCVRAGVRGPAAGGGHAPLRQAPVVRRPDHRVSLPSRRVRDRRRGRPTPVYLR